MSRFDFVKYQEQASDEQAAAKKACVELERIIDDIVPPADENSKPDFNASRARDNALKSLEETYMWIGKAIRDQQLARTGNAPLQEGRANS